MKYLLVATALLALSATAAEAVNCDADQVQYEDTCEPKPPPMGPRTAGVMNNHILPPAEFDKPFTGRLIENQIDDMEEMANVCSPNPKAAQALGCNQRYIHTVTGEVRCYVYYAPAWYMERHGVTIEAVRRHELAHCMGWPQSHPGMGK